MRDDGQAPGEGSSTLVEFFLTEQGSGIDAGGVSATTLARSLPVSRHAVVKHLDAVYLTRLFEQAATRGGAP